MGLRVEVFGIQRFSSSDSDVSFYTAYFIEPLLGQLNYRPESESYNIRGRHRSLPPIDEFFMVLVRLCLGLLEGDLAHRFNLSISSVSRILTTWIILLDQQLRPLITFPSCTVVQRHMPSQFRLILGSLSTAPKYSLTHLHHCPSKPPSIPTKSTIIH